MAHAQGASSDALAHCAVDIALRFSSALILPFVHATLPPRQTNHNFDESVSKTHLKRHNRDALDGSRPCELQYFALVGEQPSRACGHVLIGGGGRILRDVHANELNLERRLCGAHIPLSERDPSLAHALDLRSCEHNAHFDCVENVVLVPGSAVDDARLACMTFRLGSVALAHRSSPTLRPLGIPGNALDAVSASRLWADWALANWRQ